MRKNQINKFFRNLVLFSATLVLSQCIGRTDMYVNRDNYETGPFAIFGIISAILAILWFGYHVVGILILGARGERKRIENIKNIQQKRLETEKMIDEERIQINDNPYKNSNPSFDLLTPTLEKYWVEMKEIQLEFYPESELSGEEKERMDYYKLKHSEYFKNKKQTEL